jgi:hypothetical protein
MVLMVDLAAAARVARWWVTQPAEPARHRRSHAAELVAEVVPLDELLKYEAEYAAPYDTDPPRTWQWCPNDFRYESGALYPDGWICGRCFQAAQRES